MWTTWNPSTQQAGSCFVLVDFTKYLKFEFISTTWRSKGSNVSELSICMIINALLYFSSAIRRSTPNVTIYRSEVCCKLVLLKALVQFLNATQLKINATFAILFFSACGAQNLQHGKSLLCIWQWVVRVGEQEQVIQRILLAAQAHERYVGTSDGGWHANGVGGMFFSRVAYRSWV